MTNRITHLCILFALGVSLPARAVDREPPPPSAYQNVMRAQYAARQAPLPVRPEEAQRIYDAYLRSIGQPNKDQPMDSGDAAGTPQR